VSLITSLWKSCLETRSGMPQVNCGNVWQRVAASLPRSFYMQRHDRRMSVESKGGRPSKGKREPVNFWLKPAIKHAAVDKAAALGMTLTDYMAQLVVQDTGLTSDEPQEGLPFANVA